MTGDVEGTAPRGAGWYVYGVVEADATPPAGVAGVSGRVGALREGDVAALVSRVELEEFGEESVRSRLEDPIWLAEKASAHEAVLSAALVSGAVVPFRFLTIYRDDDQLRDFLARHRHDLTGVLRRVRGQVEVGVKAFVDRAALERNVADESPSVAALDAEIEGAAAGRAYLLRRRRDEAAREEAARLEGEVANDVHACLVGVAEDGVANPVQSREVSGRQEDMILNGAYLVSADDRRIESALHDLRARYGRLGVVFERTGPWPPYNFVPRELAER
jgi:hypothetical protein